MTRWTGRRRVPGFSFVFFGLEGGGAAGTGRGPPLLREEGRIDSLGSGARATPAWRYRPSLDRAEVLDSQQPASALEAWIADPRP